ncbi:MAG: recombinase family protein [Alphaproteobacteria bacterium]
MLSYITHCPSVTIQRHVQVMTLAFSYIRMSTPEQMKGDSLRRQMERSRRLAESRGWTLDDSMRDLGKSAFRGHHIADGALGAFLERVRSGQVPAGSVMIVESLDRLSRETPRVALARFLDIINAGVALVTLDGDAVKEFRADTLNETDLIISIVGMARAHQESQRKSDMLKPAWANKRQLARETGKPLSGRLPMWLRLADGKFEVIPGRAEVVREMFQLTAEGIGRERLCRILNQRVIPGPAGGQWGLTSVSHILDSPAVIGKFQPKELVYEGGVKKRKPVGDAIDNYFPAIVSLDLYNRAQAARVSRALNKGGRTGQTFSNLFRGMCYCGSCGGKMEYFNKGNNLKKGGRYFMCSSVKRGGGCLAKGRYSYDHLEDSFLSNCHHFDFSRIAAGQHAELDQVRNRLARLALGKRDLEARYDNLLEVAEKTGFTDRFKVRVDDLESALKANTVETEELTRQQAALSHSTAVDALKAIQVLRTSMAEAQGEALYRVRAQLSDMIREFTAGIFFESGRVSVVVNQWEQLPALFALYVFRQRQLETRIRYEGVRGKDKEFYLDIHNRFPDGERNVQVRVGDDPEGYSVMGFDGADFLERTKMQNNVRLGEAAVDNLNRYVGHLERYRGEMKYRAAGGPRYARNVKAP